MIARTFIVRLRVKAILLLIALATMLGLSDSPCLAAEPAASEFSAVKERARRMATNRKATPAERMALISELSAYPVAAAASHIVTIGLGAPEQDTQSAARAALMGLTSDLKVNASLLAAYRREAAKSTPLAEELAIVLLATGDRQFVNLIDRMPPAGIVPACSRVCAAAIRAGDPPAIEALRTLAKSQCFVASLACRRGIINALAGIQDVAAVEALIDLLDDVRGEARGDIVTKLVRVSGKSHNTTAAAWRAWLDSNRNELGQFPLASQEHPVLDDSAAADEEMAAYYDIPIYADRVVFVIDTSGSMSGAKIEAAKRELVSAIFTLPETCFFSVLFFNSTVEAWQRQLVPATDASRRAAADFVTRLPIDGGTATCDALQAAFAFDAEAIFFLSDGEPSVGRIIAPAGIVDLVAQLNAVRGISVNTISVMGGAPFLEALADANQGSFRAIDQ